MDASPKLVKKLSDYFENYQRSNDAKSDSAGRLWFGSSVKDDSHSPCGNLFCMDSMENGKIICKQSNTKISNGMAWSHDYKKIYFSDSLENSVFSYDYNLETGEISNRQILFTVTDCVPDGMCIDRNDNLWVTF